MLQVGKNCSDGPSDVDPELVDSQLRRYLDERGLLKGANGEPTHWRIGLSKLSGRGVMASSRIERGELVYRDSALVLGPRCYSKYLPICASCHSRGCALFPCDRGCGLPICSNDCQDGVDHRGECAYLCSLEPDCGPQGWSLDVLRALVPVRALLLPARLRELCYSLQCNRSAHEAREVDMLKKTVKGTLSRDDETFMRRVCNVMDTNAFESAALHRDSDSTTSLRALFPLGALTNHQCAPNTRHLVDEAGRLIVYATEDIAEGEEITMAYTEMLWDTTMRRQFLRATKMFSCRCPRCADATEFDSFLGALRCADKDCSGRLLPVAPLAFSSNWTCSKCGTNIKNKQISYIRAGILAATEEVIYENPRKILQFVKRELSVLVPKNNCFMLDMMFRVVSLFGRADGYTWEDLTDEELDVKAEYCKHLVATLDLLKCGGCMKKGLILYELYCTNAEKRRRMSLKGTNDSKVSENEVSVCEQENCIVETVEILKNDVAAPRDYRELYAARSSS
ncbi:protein msta-like [Copidosoma floridanum]|uniref:protein msta-like n=1 Tax=Copidosoma floridanum TaxID=29053 RepID=UPI0006C967E7|nr:protein msta-like [Copidosoma floridanum]